MRFLLVIIISMLVLGCTTPRSDDKDTHTAEEEFASPTLPDWYRNVPESVWSSGFNVERLELSQNGVTTDGVSNTTPLFQVKPTPSELANDSTTSQTFEQTVIYITPDRSVSDPTIKTLLDRMLQNDRLDITTRWIENPSADDILEKSHNEESLNSEASIHPNDSGRLVITLRGR